MNPERIPKEPRSNAEEIFNRLPVQRELKKVGMIKKKCAVRADWFGQYPR